MVRVEMPETVHRLVKIFAAENNLTVKKAYSVLIEKALNPQDVNEKVT